MTESVIQVVTTTPDIHGNAGYLRWVAQNVRDT